MECMFGEENKKCRALKVEKCTQKTCKKCKFKKTKEENEREIAMIIDELRSKPREEQERIYKKYYGNMEPMFSEVANDV